MYHILYSFYNNKRFKNTKKYIKTKKLYIFFENKNELWFSNDAKIIYNLNAFYMKFKI